MRILIVSIYYPPEPVPKPGELAIGLARRGHDVTVLTGVPSYPSGRVHPGYRNGWPRQESVNGVRVIRLPTFPDRSAVAWRRSLHYALFAVGATLGGLLRAGPQDIVYVWGNPPTSGLAGYLVSRVRRARFVYGVHDLWPDLALASRMVRPGAFVGLIRRLERFLWRRADLVLPVSEGFRSTIVQEVGRPAEVITLPHWADASVYRPVPRPAALASELGVDGRFTILYAGNLGRLQGLENLIRAAALVRDTEPQLRVLLAGAGIERPELERVARAAGATNVQFLGAVPPERVVELSMVADALYVGLLSDGIAERSVPSKFITYLACGRPIICNVPGETTRITTQEAVGVVCDRNAPDGIAEAMRKLMAMGPEARAAMGERALAAFRRVYDMELLLDKHDALMRGLVPDAR